MIKMFGKVAETKLTSEGEPDEKPGLGDMKSAVGRTWGSVNKSYCGVINCPNSTYSCPNLWFFKLPHYVSEPYRRHEWLKQIGRLESLPFARLLVCEKHFEDKDIVGGTKKKPKKHLRPGAVPSLFLPPPQPESPYKNKPKHVYQRTNISLNKVYQKATTKTNNEKPSTLTASNTQENMEHVSNDNEELFRLSSLCNTLCNINLDHLIKLYLKFKNNKESSSQIYSDKFKLKILQLYFANPKGYKVLQSTLLLPPVSTLPSFVPSTQDGINKSLITSLQAKIALMSHDQKYGTLCVNIMKIRPFVHYDYDSDTVIGIGTGVNFVRPMQYALVVMVRGIITELHQIFAISLLATLSEFREFNTWIDRLILKLIEIGITIKAVVTGTDPFFLNAFTLREMELVGRPFFTVNNLKVYHIFDPLHSMMLLHNELKNNVIFCGNGSEAKWEHILQFYDVDSTRKFRLTRGSCSLDTNDLQQNKLSTTTQILSLRTAAGIMAYVDLAILDRKAIGTADFILNTNKIFTWLYPAALEAEYKHMLNNETEDFFMNNTKFLKKLDARNCLHYGPEAKSKFKFIQCFSSNIRSILHMQKESPIRNHGSVSTQNLNLDPLTEIIDEIYLKCEKRKYLTTTEFFEIIKDHYILNNSQNEENNNDMGSFIEHAGKITELQNCFTEPLNKTLDKRSLESYNEDYTLLSYNDAISIFYVATYLLDKMYIKFKNSVSSRMKFINSSVFYENREPGFSGSIIVPDNDFLQFVYNMDSVFVNYCKKAMTSAKLYEELMKQMSKFIVAISIDIGPLEYIIGLFVDLRLYHTIKYNNDVYEKDDVDADFVVRRLSSPGVNTKTVL